MQIIDMTALELGRAIKEKKVSVREAVQASLDRIGAVDGSLNSFVTVDGERVLAQADEVQRGIDDGSLAGPLAGVPVAVKDNICTQGLLTTCSSKILYNFVPTYEAEAIINMKKAGAVILGKTNMDEFAMGSTTETSAFGPTKNPWNTEHVPGGSSGGSCAAVASREAPYALGSDTGGSIRQPASFCGVTGLKPTYGTVSRYGLIAYGSSLDQIGPIAKDVSDCAAILEMIASYDVKDSTSVNRSGGAGCISDAKKNSAGQSGAGQFGDRARQAAACSAAAGSAGAAQTIASMQAGRGGFARAGYDFTAALVDDVRGLRVGIPSDYLGAGLDDEVRQAVMSAADVLRQKGAVVEEFDLSLVEYAIPAYYVIASAEASSNLARFDGVKYGYRASEYEGLHGMYKKSRSEGFGEEVKRRIMLGSFVLSSGYYDAYYLKALRTKALIRQSFDRAFAKYDVILAPASPATAPRLGDSLSDPLKMYLGDIYTISVNLAGLPGISVPCCLDKKGLPIGVQMIGDCFQEKTILRAAYAYEQARGPWRLPEMKGGEQ